ncbi:MAG: hypothetical protein JWN50_766 [Parcubacteria group bacterium]|nr:hypothetical protein [Parcubacteria group bacterium]
MELPQNLKALYRHWPLHTPLPSESTDPNDLFSDIGLYTDMSEFIKERIEIWRKKTRGESAPYTNDPILSEFRFCNIFREFDKQTIEFHTLLNPIRNDFPLWLLNMFYCRMVARPETIHATGLLSFDEKENELVYKKLCVLPRPRFGNAYVFPVSTIMRSATPTRELFITKYLPAVMKEVSREIESWQKLSVYEGVEKILPLFGFNLHFLWTEMLIDTAYQFPEHLDLFARFPIGPGAAPTMRRIDGTVDPTLLVEKLARIPFDTVLTVDRKPLRLSAENWEGIGCEFRKYTNLKAGHGRRRLYKSR